MNEKEPASSKLKSTPQKIFSHVKHLTDVLRDRHLVQYDDGYWTYYQWGNWPRYDGKYKIPLTHEDIQKNLSRFQPLVDQKICEWVKYKNESTPMIEKYRDQLPPVFLYVKWEKNKQLTLEKIKEMGVSAERIDDIREPIEFQKQEADRTWETLSKKTA